MPTLTRDFADFSTSFLPHISDCPTARSSVRLRGLNQFASYASHLSITEIVYLSIKLAAHRLRSRFLQLILTSTTYPKHSPHGLHPYERLPFLQVNQWATTFTSSRSQPINFRGGLAQYSLLLVFGQVRDTAPNRIHRALIGAAEQHHRPIRPKHDSLCSEGCQNTCK